MKLSDIASIVLLVLVGYMLYNDMTKVDPEIEIIDNTKKLDSISKAIKSLNEKIDPMVNERIDHILNKEYEGMEHCIDTIYVDGKFEYHWNGCN